METFGERLKKTASEVAERITEAAHQAGERLNQMNELQRLNGKIRGLKRERDQCRLTMADLLIRMFDQNTFAEALLRPEYQRVKEIDDAIAAVEVERDAVQARMNAAPAPALEEPGVVIPPVESAPADMPPTELPPEVPIIAEATPPVDEPTE